jgi:hypothetical protein
MSMADFDAATLPNEPSQSWRPRLGSSHQQPIHRQARRKSPPVMPALGFAALPSDSKA